MKFASQVSIRFASNQKILGLKIACLLAVAGKSLFALLWTSWRNLRETQLRTREGINLETINSRYRKVSVGC